VEIRETAAMNEQSMREILARKPFSPVVLLLSSGQSLTITHSENVLLTKTKLVVSYPDRDVVTWAPLLHITSVEMQETG
jgi:hypothetical protein